MSAAPVDDVRELAVKLANDYYAMKVERDDAQQLLADALGTVERLRAALAAEDAQFFELVESIIGALRLDEEASEDARNHPLVNLPGSANEIANRLAAAQRIFSGDDFLHWQMDRTEGEHGFRNDMVHLLRDEAANYAVSGLQQSDPRLRRAARARERTFDEIASIILRFLPAPEARDGE